MQNWRGNLILKVLYVFIPLFNRQTSSLNKGKITLRILEPMFLVFRNLFLFYSSKGSVPLCRAWPELSDQVPIFFLKNGLFMLLID